MKFRKKPVIVEAEQFVPYPEHGDLPKGVHPASVQEEAPRPYVITAHGQRVYVDHFDWIIEEPDGRGYYPCKPDIFEATYERVQS